MPKVNLHEKLRNLDDTPSRLSIGEAIKACLLNETAKAKVFEARKLWNGVDRRMRKEGNEDVAEMQFTASEISDILRLADGIQGMGVQTELTRVLDFTEYQKQMGLTEPEPLQPETVEGG